MSERRASSSKGPALVDQEARDRIAHDLDTTLVVEAAAGTGKTTALVERVLSLLRSGKATLESLVAVTFTEKAAGEMKLRLRTEIEAARSSCASGDERARLDQALEHLEAAHIGTIHAFCADLLRARPVEARIDPLFEVVSEDDAQRLVDEAFTAWFQKTLASPGEGVSRVLRRATRERDQDGPRHALQRAAATLIGQRDFPTPWRRPAFDRTRELDAVLDRLRALARLADAGTKDDADYGRYLVKSLEEIDRVVSEIDRLEEGRAEETRDYDGVEALLRRLATSRCWGWKGSGQWYNRAQGISRQHVLDVRAEAKEELARVLDRADADLAACLFEELWPVVEAYDALKARAGKLDFLDLLVLTRDLIAGDDEVRRELQARFSHLLVDEFQDTDPLQADLLLLLAADDPAERSPSRARVVPGKLFVVGDPKQSIYRFRRAEVSLYEGIKARLEAQGASVVQLTTSFRSAPSIQRFVNAAFEPLMKPNDRGSQAAYVPLAPFRPEPAGRPTVVALPVPRPYSDYGKITSYRIEESLPDAVGAFVDWLVNQSGWKVTERGSPEPVPIEARHVCLLFRRLQSFGDDVTRPYVRALEVRRVPHVLVGGRGFHEREEVIALRNALAAIEWPDDPFSVYATLRGPFFALADEQLLAFKHAQKHLHPLRRRDEDAMTDLTRPVAEALRVLAELHRGRNRRPIADTIARLLEETRAHAGVAIWPSGAQALGNISRLLDMSRRFERGAITSFRAFIARLEDDAERGGVNDAAVVEEGTSGVRIMTVHKAKGLEFPVVVLADPTAPLVNKNPSRFVDPGRRLCAVPLCGAAPAELLERRDALVEEDREEGLRLLYVATTRARELLVVPAIGDEGEAGAGWLEPLRDVVYPRERRASRSAPGCPAFGDDTVVDRPQKARPKGPAVRPGLHRPIAGDHDVVFWDPLALALEVEDTVGLRQQKILAADEAGVVAREGEVRHRAWKEGREATRARASAPSVVVKSVGELAGGHAPTEGAGGHAPTEGARGEAILPGAGEGGAPAEGVAVAETGASRQARPHGKRFGILVHAVLAAVSLDADAAAVADAARVQGRVVGANDDEVEAARDAASAALAHPLLARARAAARVTRETPVMLLGDDGAVVEGVVDLAFFEDGAGWTVIDFKTDVDLERRRAAYARQVEAYARAIAAATGEPAKGALLQV